MSRTLIRFVFPQFVIRLTIVAVVMAVGVYSYARFHRIGAELDRIRRETEIVVAGIGGEEFDALAVYDLLARITEATGIAIGLHNGSGMVVFASGPEIYPAFRERTRQFFESSPHQIEPFASGSNVSGIVRPVSIPSVPAAHYLTAVSDASALEEGLRTLSVWLIATVTFFFLVIFSMSYRVVRSIQGPVEYLQTAANRFADGDLNHRADIPEPREFRRLAETMNGMAGQLKMRIDAIRAQRTQLESILASMTEGVVLLDDRFQIRTMNDAAIRLFRVESLTTPRGEPRTLLEVIRNSEIYDAVLKTFSSGKNQERTITVYTNPPRYMQVNSGIVESGEGNAVLLVFNDVTRMQELENIRRDFVANVSHELKTPITSILGFVETLTDAGSQMNAEEMTRFLNIVASQAHRLNAIIEDLLQLSRLEQQHDGIVLEEFRIEELIAGLKQSLEQRALARNITLLDQYSGNPRVVANSNLLEQALANLVDNAIKYCPPGSEVEIRYRRAAKAIRLEVADNGPGIPPEAQGRIFERFYRVDRARSRAAGGTGLGLAIVKHIAQAHGGAVSLHSTPGTGSTFVLELPQLEQTEDSPA